MKRVITYGTFDVLHNGHVNILKRAKALGDYLVVGVTSEDYDLSRGKLNVVDSLSKRIDAVRKTGLADKIIVEEYPGQKYIDIKKYNIDTFVIGSDWLGKFDYLNEICEVVYLPRTQGVSSTDLRKNKNGILKIGVIGYGRIAERFIKESKYVSGVEVVSVFGLNEKKINEFKNKFELCSAYININEFYQDVDAVYIATPHTYHYKYAISALENGKHVLCEKPMVLSKEECVHLYNFAAKNNLIIQEAIKTAYLPCFSHILGLAKTGVIGKIKSISATFTKIIKDKSLREYNNSLGGGAFNELCSYNLFAVIKLLGSNFKNVSFISNIDKETNVDTLTKADIIYDEAYASITCGIGAKSEGELIISGTDGYIYVPAPWWKTEYFEVRYEDLSKTQKYFYKFDGDGLRYEIADFLKAINSNKPSYKLTKDDCLAIADIVEKFNLAKENDTNIIKIK